MNDRENRRFDAFGRVQNFCAANAGDFTPGSKALTCAADIGNVIIQLVNARANSDCGASLTNRACQVSALYTSVEKARSVARGGVHLEGSANSFRTIASACGTAPRPCASALGLHRFTSGIVPSLLTER